MITKRLGTPVLYDSRTLKMSKTIRITFVRQVRQERHNSKMSKTFSQNGLTQLEKRVRKMLSFPISGSTVYSYSRIFTYCLHLLNVISFSHNQSDHHIKCFQCILKKEFTFFKTIRHWARRVLDRIFLNAIVGSKLFIKQTKNFSKLVCFSEM